MWIHSVISLLRTQRLPTCVLALVLGFLPIMEPAFAIEASSFKPVAGNPPAPNLKLMRVGGETINLKDLRGKVVLVNFWATWCIPCRKEMPSMQRLWLKLQKSPLQILAVNVGEDETAVNKFMSTLEISPTFPILLDHESSTLETWPVKVLPTSFLIDKQGRISHQLIGGLEFDSPESVALIAQLLARDNVP